MLELASLSENSVQARIEKIGKKTKVKDWVRVDASDADTIPEFPKLTLQDLRNLTFGLYQLKQAKSYTQEHIKEDGSYEMFVGREFQDLICVKLRSRHVTSKVYYIWIEYAAGGSTAEAITGWYCTCPNGARLVGCCAHIAAGMWYLSYARHDDSLDLIYHWPTNILDASQMDDIESDQE